MGKTVSGSYVMVNGSWVPIIGTKIDIPTPWKTVIQGYLVKSGSWKTIV